MEEGENKKERVGREKEKERDARERERERSKEKRQEVVRGMIQKRRGGG